jgi:tol-pal system protein YbgF
MNLRNIAYSIIVAGVMMTSAPAAMAQSVNSLDARLDRIERDMQTLSRSVFKGDVPPPSMQQGAPSNTAAIEMRLNQIEDQLRRVTGMIEENAFRIRQMDNAGGMTSNQPMQPQRPTPPPPSNFGQQETPSFAVDNRPYQLGTLNNNSGDSPAGMYDQAFAYLQTNDYASAGETFDQFLTQYPDHSLVANAKYWLGETYMARSDYQAASRAFARYFKDHPEGSRAPDSLLKLAESLNEQGMSNEACLTLTELKNRFPDASPSIQGQADDHMMSYGCNG